MINGLVIFLLVAAIALGVIGNDAKYMGTGKDLAMIMGSAGLTAVAIGIHTIKELVG